MNTKNSLIVHLTDLAIEAVESHIREKSIESRIVFLINPASFQYFSIEKFGDLLISLKDKDYLIEIILTNIKKVEQHEVSKIIKSNAASVKII